MLDLLDSAVLEHGQVGRLQICNQDLQLVQIGVAGQPLASELGWFDQCSWLLSTPRLAVWQICNFATLPGDSFVWRQVGSCSVSAAWAGWQV